MISCFCCFNLYAIFISYYCDFIVVLASKSILVCPHSTHNVDSLVKYRYSLLCDEIKLDCQLDTELTVDNYLQFIIILYDSTWKNAKNVVEKLSSCYIEPLFIDVNSTNVNLEFVCSQTKTAIVFDLTDVKFEVFERNYTTCVQQNSSLPIISTCPNIAWVGGTSSCHSNVTTYVVKVLRNDVRNDVIGDNMYSKEFLRNKHLRVGTNHYLPFVKREISKRGTNSYTGILFQAFNKMAENMDFTFEVIEPADKKFGVFLNNTWNGLIKQLIDGETDIAVAPLTQTYERSTVVDFTAIYYYETIGIIFKLMPQGSKLWRMFSLFDASAWCATWVTLLFSTVFLYALNKLSAVPNESEFNGFFNCFWYNISCMLNQGGEIEPETWSAQNFLATWWLYVFAMLSIYSGGLIAMLTSSQIILPFKDLQSLSKLVEQGKYKVCIQSATAFHQAVLYGGQFEMIRTFLENNPQYSVPFEEMCGQLVLNSSDVVYLGEMTLLKEFQKFNCANTTLIILDEDNIFPGFFSFAVRKNSPLNTIVSLATIEIMDSGLMDAWMANYSQKSKFCKIYEPNDMVSAESKSLALEEVTGPFILCAIGLVGGVIGFIFEIRHKICRKITKETVKKMRTSELS